MSVKRVYQKAERTPEQLAELRAAREHYQRTKPTLDQAAAEGGTLTVAQVQPINRLCGDCMDWFASRGLTRTEGDTVLLDVPDHRQQDDYSCGAVALRVLFEYHGVKPRLWKPLVDALPNPVQGMAPDTVESVLYSVFGRPPLRGALGIDDLRHLTRTGRPVLCPITCERDDGSRGGHWVCVRGVGRGRVYVHCPTNGRESYTLTDWDRCWVDESEGGSVYHRFGLCGWPGE